MNNNSNPLYPLENVDSKPDSKQQCNQNQQQNTYNQNNQSNQYNPTTQQSTYAQSNQNGFDFSNLLSMLGGGGNNQDMLGMITKLMGINGSADILSSISGLMGNKKNSVKEQSKTKTKHYIKADECEYIDN